MSTTITRGQSRSSPFGGADPDDLSAILARNWWLIGLRGLVLLILTLKNEQSQNWHAAS